VVTLAADARPFSSCTSMSYPYDLLPMACKLKNYTEMGRRIAALAETQKPIARALGLTQQTASKKLNGHVVITVSELKKLAKAFKVPMAYFFEAGEPDPKVDALLRRVRSKGRTLRDLLVLAGKLSARDQKKLAAAARAFAR